MKSTKSLVNHLKEIPRQLRKSEIAFFSFMIKLKLKTTMLFSFLPNVTELYYNVLQILYLYSNYIRHIMCYRFWGLLMFGSYSVCNIIVLLNMLIAMMSNSYTIISERSDLEWKFARSKNCFLHKTFCLFKDTNLVSTYYTLVNPKTIKLLN